MNDDWHEETRTRLAQSSIYKTLTERCEQDPKGAQILTLVDEGTHYCYHRTKTILRHMGEFTVHDGDHLFRVLSLMERVIGEESLNQLSTPELLLLILSAFFHDIGMAPDEKSVLSWRKAWDKTPEFDTTYEEKEYRKFTRFYAARPEMQDEIDALVKSGNASKADLMKAYLISDYIRQTHAVRAKEIIAADWDNKILYGDSNLTVDFAELCFSHNEDALKLLNLDMEVLCGTDTFACIPYVGVVLRLADILDFDAKRTPFVLFSHLWVRHPLSLVEWNKHRAIQSWTIGGEKIQFHAKCQHPAIEASIHEFCDMIDQELSACRNVISEINKRIGNRLNKKTLDLPLEVDRTKIETKKGISGNPLYTYRRTQFSLSKRQVIELLMGTKLYGDPEVALRELLQNSIDACLLRKALEESWGNDYHPEIGVRYYTEDNQDILEVIDNGTGMDQHIIDNYYSKVGVSFYKSSEFFDIRAEADAQFSPTSRFGIGILSCFMVADSICVDTRRVYEAHKSSDPIRVLIEGQESIFWITGGERDIPGTSTKLHLRKAENPWERMDEDEFIKSVDSLIPNPPFKITIKTDSKESVKDEESFKNIGAESIENRSWDDHDNIRIISINLRAEETGIIGAVRVGILEMHGKAVPEIEVKGKTVLIDDEEYQLDKVMHLSKNEIELSTTSISIDDDGNVESSPTFSRLAKSNGQISLHGIEVATDLFADSWRLQKGQARIVWPFPMLAVLDICNNRDLELNSARTQILLGDKWDDFEEALAFLVCQSISQQVTPDYWSELIQVLSSSTSSKNFKIGLDRAIKEQD